MHRNRNPCNSFPVVKMASGMDHRRLRPTMMMTTSHNMAAIQLIPISCSLGLQHISSILEVHIMFKLTAVISSNLLTSITWPYRGLRFRAHEGFVFFFKFTTDQVLVSFGSWAHVRLTCWKQGRIVRKPVNANPGLKVNQIITFSPIQMFFAALFCVYGDH